MKLKKVFSAVAAAAIAVSGLAMGAATASAAAATFGDTITLTATDKAQLEGHTFSAIKLANYKSDADGYVSLETNHSTNTIYNKIYEAALAIADPDTIPAGTDPMGYVSGLGGYQDPILDEDQNLGDNQHTSKPWRGSVRDFVNDLTDDDTLKNAATAQTLGAITGDDANGYSANLTPGAGLWLIFDTTNPVTDKDVNSIPMLVGTQVNNASNKFIDDSGAETVQWPTTYMGKVAIKNQVTTVNKTVDGKEQISASVGSTVNYAFDAPLPVTTGFSSEKPYSFFLTDTPSVGQTVKLNTVKVFVDKDGDRTYTKDTDKLLTQYVSNSTDVKDYTLTKGASKTASTDVQDTDVNSTTDTDLVADFDKTANENVGNGDTAQKFFVDLSAFVSSEAYQNDYETYKDKNVVVTYQATITANAPTIGVLNEVKVNSQNATATDSTKVTNGGFSFTKTDAQDNDLTGAKFAIKNSNGKYLKQGEDGQWTEVADVADSERAGDSDNAAKFTYTGLADGTYTIEETQVPTGYLSTAKVTFTVTIKDGKAVHFDETDAFNGTNDLGSAEGTEAINDYKVKNYKNISQLPLTGAAGIAMFTVIGLLLAGAGVTVYLKSRSTRRALRV